MIILMMTLKEITTESTESKNGLQMAYAILPQSPYGLESGKRVFILYTANFCEKSNGRVYRLGIWQCWS